MRKRTCECQLQQQRPLSVILQDEHRIINLQLVNARVREELAALEWQQDQDDVSDSTSALLVMRGLLATACLLCVHENWLIFTTLVVCKNLFTHVPWQIVVITPEFLVPIDELLQHLPTTYRKLSFALAQPASNS